MLFRLPENWWLWEHAQTTYWPTDDIHAGSVLASALHMGGDFLLVATVKVTGLWVPVSPSLRIPKIANIYWAETNGIPFCGHRLVR